MGLISFEGLGVNRYELAGCAVEEIADAEPNFAAAFEHEALVLRSRNEAGLVRAAERREVRKHALAGIRVERNPEIGLLVLEEFARFIGVTGLGPAASAGLSPQRPRSL
jgi:hypothetical protein